MAIATRFNFKRYGGILVVAVVSVVGVALLVLSHAATPAVSVEAEAATSITSGASIVGDTTASGGQAVLFGGPNGLLRGTQTAGFYPCTGTDQLSCFKTESSLLNRPPSSLHVTLQTDSTSASNMSSNGWGYFVGDGKSYPYQWQTLSPHPALTISVPLAFGAQDPSQNAGSAGLTAVANGTYDASYTKLVNYALAAHYSNITWRLGWEFDGNWMPWTSQNDSASFVAAYRHVHDLIKGLMPDATFDFCGTNGYIANGSSVNAVWTAAYPGDSYVDTIGLDVYDFQYNTTAALFDSNILPSLKAQDSFAVAHGKQVSYPEWGLGDGANKVPGPHDNPLFIQSMFDWFNSLPTSGAGSLNYNDYFNADVGGASSLDANPNAQALFVKLFSL